MLQTHSSAPKVVSPLILCDRLIALAQEADRAGHVATASDLVRLAHSVFEEKAMLS
jgi:hypothetical protein